MRKLLMALIALAAVALTASCAKPESPFVQVGRYVSRDRDRVFVVTFPDGVTEQEMRQFGMLARNTSGRLTAVFFYPEGRANPGSDLSAARSLDQAMEALSGGPAPAYAYERATNGRETFVNCVREASSLLC